MLLAGSLGLIAYVFVGYPAIIALWARIAPRPVAADPAFTPSVSLLIFAHDEQDVIGARLRNVAELDYEDELLEVIVVADGSGDRTAEIAQAAGARVLHKPEREGKLAAIRRGVAVAHGEILVFSDANNTYVPQTLRALVAPFADPSVGVVTGSKLIDDSGGRQLDRAEGLYWRYESQIKRWESTIGSVTGVAGEVLATRRSAFRAPADGLLTEDFAQALLAAVDGWRIVYAPDARSTERASATLADERTRRARIVTGRYQAIARLLPALLRADPRLAWQVVSHKALRPLVPWAMATALLSNLALARRSVLARGLLAAQAGFYALAARGRTDEARGRRRTLTYLPYYFCHMNVASLQGLRAFLRHDRTGTWTRVARG